MAQTPLSAVLSTSGDTWMTLVTGASAGTQVTQVTCASNAFGQAKVSMRFTKGSTSAVIVPGDALPEAASYRYRVGALTLMSGDKLEVKSIGSVDWTLSGANL